MNRWPFFFSALVVFLAVHCRDEAQPGRICTTEARVGIQVSVRDSLSGLPAAGGAVAVIQDQSFIDTLRAIPFADSLMLYGAYERPGVYTVLITKSGYRNWLRTNVVVNKDECHVITVQLDARLQRNP